MTTASTRTAILVGDKTISHIARELARALHEQKVEIEISEAGFDGWMRETVDAHSVLRTSGAQIWIYLLSPRVLEAQTDLTRQLEFLLSTLDSLPTPPTVLFGTFFVDPRVARPLTSCLELGERAAQLNLMLYEFRRRRSWFHIIEMQGLISAHGLDALTDARFEASAQMYYAPRAAGAVSVHLARPLAALQRPSSKVCVVDLDNTLWRGIVGEDGPENLQMADSGAGAPHRRFQRGLLALKETGVLLAVCSKNNAAEALSVLESHPDSLLRPRDFAALEISWDPKSEGLRRIAQRLNLGLDSLVFIDDSPFEREEIRRSLPQVLVADFPKDPALLGQILADLAAFDTLRITDEDRLRSGSYASEASREALRASSTSPEDFFRSLNIGASLFRASAETTERLHQLILKTNQFNLTGERLTQGEFAVLCADPNSLVVGIRVSDKFGDSGITGLVIIEHLTSVQWQVRNLLLSCRIIGRTVEFALVNWILQAAAQQGAEAVALPFRATGRNDVARQFLARLGLLSGDDSPALILSVGECDRLPQHFVNIVDNTNPQASNGTH